MEGNIVWAFIAAMGIPSTIMGLFIWWLKGYIDKREKKREEKEKSTEKLIILLLKETRSTNVLATATAKAVQRIPDAHCNGDMTEALATAAKIQKEEKEFILNEGIKHIIED